MTADLTVGSTKGGVDDIRTLLRRKRKACFAEGEGGTYAFGNADIHADGVRLRPFPFDAELALGEGIACRGVADTSRDNGRDKHAFRVGEGRVDSYSR